MKLHLQKVLRLNSLPEFKEDARGSFSFRVLAAEVIVTAFENLPKMPSGALLDLDVDFFAFPHAMSSNHLMGPLLWDPAAVCKKLTRLVPDPAVVTVSSSV